jgi:hypothetical protein
MSATSAEPSRAPLGISALTVVGVAVGLMLLGSAVAYLFVLRGGPIDGEGQLQSAFGVRALPFDLSVVQAHEMAGGEKLIVLENKGLPAETEPVAPPAPLAKIDWKNLPIRTSGTPPRRVRIVWLEGASAAEKLSAFFTKVEFKDLGKLGPEGGLTPIDAGKIPWHGFDADYVHERSFEPGGTFRDAMRVNLSLANNACMLTATWSRGEAASKKALQPLLDALQPK